MKKLLSIFLATAMLISLIPAVFAAGTETGIKIVYNFTDEDVINTYLPQDNERGYLLDPTDLTYDTTKGFWAYAEDSYGDKTDIASLKDTGVRINTTYHSFQVSSNKTDNTKAWWIAFKLYVPKAGTYALTADVRPIGKMTSQKNSCVNAYIFSTESVASAGKTIKEKILAGINREGNPVTTENLTVSSTQDFRHTLSFDKSMNLPAGEHYFVFVPTITVGTTTTSICLHSLTLTEDGTGTGNAIMGGKISGVSDTLEIDGTATVSATGYFSSTGNTISDFTYSVEGDAVAIVGDTVAAKNAGTATIIATSASAVEGCNTITKTVKVVKQDEELTGAFIQEEAKEEIETYVPPTTIGIMADDTMIEATPDADGGYNLTAPATNEDGEKFLYWALGLTGNKRIVSFDATLKNYVPAENGRNYLIAVYEGDITDTKNEYYNINGQLIAKQENAPEEMPSTPGLGTAKEWKPCGGNIFVAEYADTVRDNVTVTAVDCTVNGNAEAEVAYGTLITCTAAGEGTFKCWTKKGVNEEEAEIVSIDEAYSFYAWEDCTVEAVYANHYYTGSNMNILIDSFTVDGGVIGVMAEFIGFEDKDVVEKGIMFTAPVETEAIKIPMTTTDNQLTVVADGAGTYTGYAILKEDNVYKMITGGSYSK